MSADEPASATVAAALTSADALPLDDDAIAVAIRQDVAALLAASPSAATLTNTTRPKLLAHVRGAAAHAAALDGELRRVLPMLAAAGEAPPIVIKGAHLAHAVYPSPHLRPRADSDLLIAPGDRAAVTAALAAAGYSPAPMTSGSLILGQFLYQKPLGPGLVHYIDVHWRVASPLVFAESFDAKAIGAASVPVAGLGAAARGPSLADALALACVHIVAHHWPEASLRWLYDLRLLAGSLDAAERARFARGAVAGRYRQVAISALARANATFPSVSLDDTIAALDGLAASAEPSAVLTATRRRPLDDFLLDLRTAGWRRGVRLVREHLLPPPDYMRVAFAAHPLPVAYAARLVRAVRRRL